MATLPMNTAKERGGYPQSGFFAYFYPNLRAVPDLLADFIGRSRDTATRSRTLSLPGLFPRTTHTPDTAAPR